MRAKIITYSTERLSSTQRSILSKAVNGYLDKSNKGKYMYKRKGIIQQIPNMKISNKTFIIRDKDFKSINEFFKKRNVKIKSWDIEIKKL